MLSWLITVIPVAVAARQDGIRLGRSDLYEAVLAQRLATDSVGRAAHQCLAGLERGTAP